MRPRSAAAARVDDGARSLLRSFNRPAGSARRGSSPMAMVPHDRMESHQKGDAALRDSRPPRLSARAASRVRRGQLASRRPAQSSSTLAWTRAGQHHSNLCQRHRARRTSLCPTLLADLNPWRRRSGIARSRSFERMKITGLFSFNFYGPDKAHLLYFNPSCRLT